MPKPKRKRPIYLPEQTADDPNDPARVKQRKKVARLRAAGWHSGPGESLVPPKTPLRERGTHTRRKTASRSLTANSPTVRPRAPKQDVGRTIRQVAGNAVAALAFPTAVVKEAMKPTTKRAPAAKDTSAKPKTKAVRIIAPSTRKRRT